MTACNCNAVFSLCFKGQTQKMRIEIDFGTTGYDLITKCFKGQTQKMRIEICHVFNIIFFIMRFKGQTQKMRIEIAQSVFYTVYPFLCFKGQTQKMRIEIHNRKCCNILAHVFQRSNSENED